MKGPTPATGAMGIPSEFPDPPNPPYRPENVDGKFRGPLAVRLALANSVNIPAIKTIQFAGVQDTIETAHRMGITTLNRKDTYGLSLTLGGGGRGRLAGAGRRRPAPARRGVGRWRRRAPARPRLRGGGGRGGGRRRAPPPPPRRARRGRPTPTRAPSPP